MSARPKVSAMKIRLMSAAALAALALAACGGDNDAGTASTQEPAAGATAPAGSAAEFNDADVMFAQGMIPHHEQAIEMADIALDPNVGAGPAVIDLATRIKGGQDPEIEQMKGWLESWGQPMQMDMSDGHDMAGMDGMMTVEEMDELGTMTGPAFDRMWMEMMIRHHEGAIEMADTVKADGSNADVRTLADAIIGAQQAEIAEMQALLGS
jgi:uncharacterized protein (DUF305 family)